jgi:hypothetical protein
VDHVVFSVGVGSGNFGIWSPPTGCACLRSI